MGLAEPQNRSGCCKQVICSLAGNRTLYADFILLISSSLLLLLFYWLYNPTVGFSLLIPEVFEITRNDTSQSVGLLWTSDHPVAEISTWQHTTLKTNIHAPGGIRTRNPSKRSAADTLLRPLGHWDGHLLHYIEKIIQGDKRGNKEGNILIHSYYALIVLHRCRDSTNGNKQAVILSCRKLCVTS